MFLPFLIQHDQPMCWLLQEPDLDVEELVLLSQDSSYDRGCELMRVDVDGRFEGHINQEGKRRVDLYYVVKDKLHMRRQNFHKRVKGNFVHENCEARKEVKLCYHQSEIWNEVRMWMDVADDCLET